MHSHIHTHNNHSSKHTHIHTHTHTSILLLLWDLEIYMWEKQHCSKGKILLVIYCIFYNIYQLYIYTLYILVINYKSSLTLKQQNVLPTKTICTFRSIILKEVMLEVTYIHNTFTYIYIQSFIRSFCPKQRTREITVKLRAIKTCCNNKYYST